jgi:hypothetical protein
MTCRGRSSDSDTLPLWSGQIVRRTHYPKSATASRATTQAPVTFEITHCFHPGRGAGPYACLGGNKSLRSVRDKIRANTNRNEGNFLEYVIASLNPFLRGCYDYSQHAHRFTFSSVDGLIRRRLRAMLRRQKHRPGQGQCRRDHTQWPKRFFADLGLFTMSEAHRLARQSRCGNN